MKFIAFRLQKLVRIARPRRVGRRAMGVDDLDVGAGPGGPTVGVSRYIAKGVSVGVRTGVKPDQTSVNVGVDVFKNFRVQSETRVDGKTSVGVGVEWEY